MTAGAELLLLGLLGGGDGRAAEAGFWWRPTEGMAQPGLQGAVTAWPETGAWAAGSVTLRTPELPQLGITPALGGAFFSEPVPGEGTRENFFLSLRADYRVQERLVLILEARHLSNGRTFLQHDHNNPGWDAILAGAGWRW